MQHALWDAAYEIAGAVPGAVFVRDETALVVGWVEVAVEPLWSSHEQFAAEDPGLHAGEHLADRHGSVGRLGPLRRVARQAQARADHGRLGRAVVWLATTYAYVNPIVALLLGWLVLAVVVIASVALVADSAVE